MPVESSMMRIRTICAAAILAFGPLSPGVTHAAATNDYPTEAIAEYVYACMKTNGETREVLAACSCSIDVLASLLSYDAFVEASTFLGMMQMQGEGSELFRNSPASHAAVQNLRRAQAEGDVRCFNNVNQ
jgi:hypothetical protein